MATLREIVTGKGWDATQGIVEEVVKTVPELAFFDSTIIPGTSFQTLRLTSDPTTGFRSVGNGIDASDEGYSLVTTSLGILAGLVQRDKAAVLADVRGRDACMRAAAIATVRSAMKTLASKVWYGAASGDEKFAGAAALVKAALTVKAAGTTANKQSSVFAVGNSCDDKCGLFFGDGSDLFGQAELDWKEGLMAGSNSKPVPSFWKDLTSWAAFGCRNSNSIARLANLGDNSNLTDALLAKLVNAYRKANDGQMPDALFASYDQVEALQQARSAAYPAVRGTKSGIAAPWPTDYEGIPLFATSAISDTEAVVA